MRKEEIKKETEKDLVYFSIAIAILIIIGWIITYFTLEGEKDRGTFGDMFGSLNALYSGFALAGIIITILLQRKELILQREELRETRGEFQIQNETLKIQRFENTFFNLLSLHHKIVDGIDFRRIKDNNPFNNTQFNLYDSEDDGATIILTGRDVFTHHYQKLKEDLSDAEDFDSTYDYHYQKAQADFGHYFRNLYRIIKLVDNYQFSKSEESEEEFDKKYNYASIVRAQLSDFELLWIFYNCISKQGKEKFKPLIEKYSLLKNIPYNELAEIDHKKLYNERAFGKTSYQ